MKNSGNIIVITFLPHPFFFSTKSDTIRSPKLICRLPTEGFPAESCPRKGYGFLVRFTENVYSILCKVWWNLSSKFVQVHLQLDIHLVLIIRFICFDIDVIRSKWFRTNKTRCNRWLRSIEILRKVTNFSKLPFSVVQILRIAAASSLCERL